MFWSLVVLAFAVAVYAFVHAAMQRPDAYTAAGKLTKPVWLLIIGGSVASAAGVPAILSARPSPPSASGIYLVDVRPKILDIQGKSR